MKIFLKTIFVSFIVLFSTAQLHSQESQPLLPDNENMLLTVFLKHDQSMNNGQRGQLLRETGFRESFPPEGVEIVNHYVMMGIGQVIVMKFEPNLLRAVNRVIEHDAWGAYRTEFYITYDLAEASAFQASQ